MGVSHVPNACSLLPDLKFMSAIRQRFWTVIHNRPVYLKPLVPFWCHMLSHFQTKDVVRIAAAVTTVAFVVDNAFYQ